MMLVYNMYRHSSECGCMRLETCMNMHEKDARYNRKFSAMIYIFVKRFACVVVFKRKSTKEDFWGNS